MQIESEGQDCFAADPVAFPYELAPAPAGKIGLEDTTLRALMGAAVSWLFNAVVQDRLEAVLFYQAAVRHSPTLRSERGRAVLIKNPLFGATLTAAEAGAAPAATMLLADAARAQVDYLELRKSIPEWADKRLFELSSVSKRDFAWLPANPKRAARRARAMRASMRRG